MRITIDEIPEDGLDVEANQDAEWVRNAAASALEGQVIATALSADAVPLPPQRALFHVEQGQPSPVASS